MYYVFSFFVIVSGFTALFSKRISIQMYALIIALVPSGAAYAGIMAKNGIYFYDWYLVGIALAYIILGVIKINPRIMHEIRVLILGLSVFVVYILIAWLNSEITKHYIKDIRPILFMVLFLVVSVTAQNARLKLSSKNVLWFCILAPLFNFVDMYWLQAGFVQYSDEFYEANSYRYLDAGTYISATFIIYFALNRSVLLGVSRYLTLFALLSSVLCVLLSNSRFILISIFVAILVAQRKHLTKLFAIIVFAAVSYLLFLKISTLIGSERIIAAQDVDGLTKQLVIRFGPALNKIAEMKFWQFIFGYGAGTYFEIPWFFYRGLDVDNTNIDSAYFTFYVKYGFFGFVILYLFAKSLVLGTLGRERISYFVFLFSMFVVSALPYQPYIVGFCLAVVALNSLSGSTIVKPSV